MSHVPFGLSKIGEDWIAEMHQMTINSLKDLIPRRTDAVKIQKIKAKIKELEAAQELRKQSFTR